jgi:hypothetical protein
LARRNDPGKRWLAFLQNHREVIAAFDFFTVPTVTFQLLYCFFVIEHGRRKILHINVTRHPTADWVIQQLREAFPEAGPYRYVILDRDAKFDGDVITFLQATGLKPKRTSAQAPWQNRLAERWVGSCRREILDHIIVLNEEHLRRLLREYVNPSRRSHSRCAGEGHSQPPASPGKAIVNSKRDLPAPAGRTASSVRLGGCSLKSAGGRSSTPTGNSALTKLGPQPW